MSNSLRDQLLKAGVATEQQAKKAEHEERRRRKSKRRKGAAPTEDSAAEEARRLALAAAEAQRERDRTLNAQQLEARERKALKARMRDLVENSAVKTGQGDVRFNFTHGSKIKHIYVDAKQHAQLSKGQLAVVFYGKRYHVLPPDAADKLAELDPELFVSRVETARDDGDDPYADHPIPDDLMW